MPKFEVELAFYRTVEADNIEDAADLADIEKARLVDSDSAEELGWRGAVVVVRGKPTKGE